jgi:hypothetical protein
MVVVPLSSPEIVSVLPFTTEEATLALELLET